MKPVRVAEAIVIVLVLSAGVPALFAMTPTANTEPSTSVLVHAPLAQVQALAPGTQVVEAYDSFVIVKATADQAAALQAHGIAVDPQDAGYWIGLGAYEFDVRRGEPAIPADLRDTPTDGVDLYLVHFIGPVKTEWLTDLRAAGARVLQSLPAYAFLVSMDGAVRDAVQNLRFVDWVGTYQPAYKIQTGLAGAQGPTAVEILTVDSSDTASVVAALKEGGLTTVPFDSPGTGILSVYNTGDLGVVRARLGASLIPQIARLRTVLIVEPWSQPQLMDSDAQALLQTGLAPGSAGATRLWDSGLRGAGQIITMGDTGMDFDNNVFRENATTIQIGQPGDPTGRIGPLSVYNTTNLDRRKLVRYIPMSGYRGIDPWTGGDRWAVQDTWNAGGCPSGHGTSTSANAAGWDYSNPVSLANGMAPDAKLIIEDIGTFAVTTQCAGGGDSLAYIPDNYDNYFQPGYSNGSRIFSNSWGGTDNSYDIGAMMVDRFIWNHPDMAIFFAAGNNGPAPFTVSSPGTSKDTMTIGGANAYPGQEAMSPQSSQGPTADGRLKPDTTTFFSGFTASSDPDPSGTPWDNTNTGAVTYFGGTSHATPLAAGMGALVRQYFVQGYYPTGTAFAGNGFDPSAALVKAIMNIGSKKMTGSGASRDNTYPNNAQGWGRLLLDDALYINPATEGPRKLWMTDQMANGLATGQSVDYTLLVNSSVVPLKIVMAYSDYPALPGANPALVNNLNLQVTSPTGAVYKGNVFGTFAQGESVPNSGSFDTKNPVEGVFVNTPATGAWTIHVEAANVPVGPQGYAVAVTGDLNMGYGTIHLDKSVYGAPDTIHITVQDMNAASVTVQISSSFETTPEPVPLTETALGSGIWTGSINTQFADPNPNGTLEVSEGSIIQAVYSDINPAHDAIAMATVDASPPAISNVYADGITNAAATIHWTTNKPANSKVFFGTDPANLATQASDPTFVTSHAVNLFGLTTDTVYYYDVQSADALGLSTRDANGGIHYSFRTTFQADILLVIGDGTFTADRVAEYRDALASSKWGWNEWYVAQSGEPSLALLQQYKVVLWQPGSEEYPTVSDAERPLLWSYVDNGGRMMIDGHDLGWSLCSGPGYPSQSQYYTPARCTWYKNVVKALFRADPQTFTQIQGIAADPISGPYTTGLTYNGFRSGGYGDEISNLCQTGGTCTAAGATSSYDWRDLGGSATPDYIALKWISDTPNGTAGVGVWGGQPSKMVYTGFEFTDINRVAGVPGDPARTDILNRTIVWLLDGRYHPTVTVSSPNGGEVLTTSPATITWSATTFGGTNIATQTLYYSNNSGQGWNLIGTVAPGTLTDSWDISTLPNGNHYRVKVVVVDNGVPALSASDASDADFSIARPGGDTEGPLIWPGSIAIVPDPIVKNVLVTFTAVADDTLRGNSNLRAAELFQGAPGADGTGLAMTAQDGTFNSPVETIVYSATAPWNAGNSCFWIHAEDAANNWGPFEQRCTVVVNSAGIDRTPPLTASISGATLANGAADVRVTWPKATDEGQLGGTVAYRMMRATNIAGPYAQVGADIGLGTSPYTYTDVGAGDRAASLTYFYYVRTVDAAGNIANGTNRAGKASRDLPAGTSLVSSPLVLADTSLGTFVQTVQPVLRSAWTYDAATQTWLTYSSTRPAGQNSLKSVGVTQALYVNLTAPDQITVAGLVATQTVIRLSVGWNLVAFPSFSTTITAGSIPGTTAVLDFAAALPGQTRIMAGTDLLQGGRAYWVHVTPLPVTWTVPGS